MWKMAPALSGLVLATLVFVAAAALQVAAPPTVQLDKANFTGVYSPSGSLSLFLGIPFAQPP